MGVSFVRGPQNGGVPSVFPFKTAKWVASKEMPKSSHQVDCNSWPRKDTSGVPTAQAGAISTPSTLDRRDLRVLAHSLAFLSVCFVCLYYVPFVSEWLSPFCDVVLRFY